MEPIVAATHKLIQEITKLGGEFLDEKSIEEFLFYIYLQSFNNLLHELPLERRHELADSLNMMQGDVLQRDLLENFSESDLRQAYLEAVKSLVEKLINGYVGKVGERDTNQMSEKLTKFLASYPA